MNIHAIICTRDRNDVSETTDKLISFLCRCNIAIYLISGAKSIFSAYLGAFEKIDPAPDDVVIFCHDDIEIRDRPEDFVQRITSALSLPEAGFVGAAGTKHLNEDPVWWDINRWKEGKHSGRVIHLDPTGKEYITEYGPPEDVVVLDGLFLAAKPHVIKEVGLQKPEYFEGEWDFYDIHYTSQAFLKGYTNRVIEMNILHNSRGELVGRDSWHKNKDAFAKKTKLPLMIKD
jgi:GT2 family glycosyltransferase